MNEYIHTFHCTLNIYILIFYCQSFVKIVIFLLLYFYFFIVSQEMSLFRPSGQFKNSTFFFKSYITQSVFLQIVKVLKFQHRRRGNILSKHILNILQTIVKYLRSIFMLKGLHSFSKYLVPFQSESCNPNSFSF